MNTDMNHNKNKEEKSHFPYGSVALVAILMIHLSLTVFASPLMLGISILGLIIGLCLGWQNILDRMDDGGGSGVPWWWGGA